MRPKTASYTTLLLMAFLPTLCGQSQSSAADGESPAASRPGAATLTDIGAITELQQLFNQHQGKTRLILLLSPT